MAILSHGFEFAIADSTSTVERCESRYSQIERLIYLLEIISESRFGMSVDSIHRELSERYGTCSRTTKRDVDFLESVNLLSRTEYQYAPSTFRINEFSRLAVALSRSRRVG